MHGARLECDDKGRVVIPKEIRDEKGTQFYLVEIRGDMILVPIPKNPIKALAELGKKASPEFHKLSIKEIKAQARKDLEEEALGNLRRH